MTPDPFPEWKFSGRLRPRPIKAYDKPKAPERRAMPILRPMTQSEYAAWLAETIPAYAADKVASGQWAEDAALELSKKEYGELLPQGPATPDNHLFTILDQEAVPVGVLWFAVKTKFNARIAFVLDVSVSEGRRRQGHARRALLALEDEVRKLGLSGIALHVFGHNAGAQALYVKLGYQPTNISLFKPIGLTADRPDASSRSEERRGFAVEVGYVGEPVVVRKLTPADATAFQALRLSGLLECPAAFASSHEEEVGLAPSVVADRLAARDDRAVFGAFRGPDLVGLVGLKREERRKLSHKANLWGMYVAPANRTRGVGRALVGEALAFAQTELHVRQVGLGVNAENMTAIALYEHLGFKSFGREPCFMLIDGVAQDELQMVCMISPAPYPGARRG